MWVGNNFTFQSSTIECTLWVNSKVLKDDESTNEAKTNSRHPMCLLLAYTEHAQSPFIVHYENTHTHTQIHAFVLTQHASQEWTFYMFYTC